MPGAAAGVSGEGCGSSVPSKSISSYFSVTKRACDASSSPGAVTESSSLSLVDSTEYPVTDRRTSLSADGCTPEAEGRTARDIYDADDLDTGAAGLDRVECQWEGYVSDTMDVTLDNVDELDTCTEGGDEVRDDDTGSDNAGGRGIHGSNVQELVTSKGEMQTSEFSRQQSSRSVGNALAKMASGTERKASESAAYQQEAQFEVVVGMLPGVASGEFTNCARCGAAIATDALSMQEHDDYHFCLEIVSNSNDMNTNISVYAGGQAARLQSSGKFPPRIINSDANRKEVVKRSGIYSGTGKGNKKDIKIARIDQFFDRKI